MSLRSGPSTSAELRFGAVERCDGGAVLAVTGEIDMTTGDRFLQSLTLALAEPDVDRLTVNLGPVTFIDSNGVAALLWAHQTAAERNLGFAVINAQGSPRSILELLGVYELLTAADP